MVDASGGSRRYEELDRSGTELGELVLRRRRLPGSSDVEVHEVILDGEFLMSSLVHVSEDELARAALACLPGGGLRVLVGGLGLGHTAETALATGRVARLLVIERLRAVIEWTRRGLVPLGRRLTEDPRVQIREGDFFGLASSDALPAASFDAVLVDIDHSPSALLDPSHASFYGAGGLARAERLVAPGGVFALWSADAPDPDFARRLAEVFAEVEARPVTFFNPLIDAEELNTLYLGRRPPETAGP